jgi:hydrogenase expression/formation protein HypC
MCLAVPGLVVEVASEEGLLFARVDFGGVCKRICLAHVPEAVPGDYVLVHVGFALARIDEVEARRIFEFLASAAELEELEDRARDPDPDGAGR